MPRRGEVWNPAAFLALVRSPSPVLPMSAPDELTREALWIAVAIGAALAFGSRIAGLDTPSTFTALSLYAVVCIVILARLRRFHPFPRFGAANTVTLARAALTCALATAVLAPGLGAGLAPGSVCGLALVALALDGLDGWIARRSSLVSRFGARFDMEVDALLVMVLSMIALKAGKAGSFVLLIGLMRYLFLVARLFVGRLRADLPESLRRKSVCVIQVVVLIVILLPGVASPLSDALAAAALATLAWSFAVDTLWLLAPRSAPAALADEASAS
jgi:phosphatidylglycerophosphate synthase